jgi:hypothetical protein
VQPIETPIELNHFGKLYEIINIYIKRVLIYSSGRRKMKTSISSCELVSTVTAISCAIARCVPKEDLATVAAIFGQIASTLASILAQEDRLNPESPEQAAITPDTEIITVAPNPSRQ